MIVARAPADGNLTAERWEDVMGTVPERAELPPVDLEPDIRGAVTIRQQLDKHRSDPSCASCHSRMDPPGFALESFDARGNARRGHLADETLEE